MELAIAYPQGQASAQLHIAGRHNVRNALAAAACAHAAGVPLAAIALGLSGFEPVTGRSRAGCTDHGQSVTVVDDTYNANPDSVAAAIAVLAELPRRCWCWAIWARWAITARSSMPRPGHWPGRPGLRISLLWATRAHLQPLPLAAVLSILIACRPFNRPLAKFYPR